MRVGVYENRPILFSEISRGTEGIFADLLEDIAVTNHWEMVYVPGSWAACLDRLDRGDIDLLPAIAYSKERAAKYLFSRHTVLTNYAQVYLPRNSSIQSILDLEGKRIGVLTGDIHNRATRETLQRFGIQCFFIEQGSYVQLMDLAGGKKIDAAVVNRLWGAQHENDFDVVRSPIVFNPIQIRFAVRRDKNRDIIAAIDERMAQLKSKPDSIYYQTLNRWLSVGEPFVSFPRWLIWALLVSISLGLVFFVTSIILNKTVSARTFDIDLERRKLKREIDVRKRAEEALRESEERWRMVIRNMPVMLDAFDDQNRVLEWNRQCEEVTGYSLEEVQQADNFLHLLYPEEGRLEAILTEWKERGEFHNWEIELTRKDGTKRTVAWSNISESIQIPGWGSWAVGVDVTEMKRFEDRLQKALTEKEVLLKEIHHRVKNNMQVIISLLNLQSGREKNERVRAVLFEAQSRVAAMALVHETLYQSPSLSGIDFGQYLDKLANTLLYAFPSGSANVVVKVEVEPGIILNIDQATPCGLAINELISNSLKYAFTDGRPGEIRIGARIVREDRIELTIRDNGVGMPEGQDLEQPKTLGLLLVTELIQNQLAGELTLEKDHGVRFAIEFPWKKNRLDANG